MHVNYFSTKMEKLLKKKLWVPLWKWQLHKWERFLHWLRGVLLYTPECCPPGKRAWLVISFDSRYLPFHSPATHSPVAMKDPWKSEVASIREDHLSDHLKPRFLFQVECEKNLQVGQRTMWRSSGWSRDPISVPEYHLLSLRVPILHHQLHPYHVPSVYYYLTMLFQEETKISSP